MYFLILEINVEVLQIHFTKYVPLFSSHTLHAQSLLYAPSPSTLKQLHIMATECIHVSHKIFGTNGYFIPNQGRPVCLYMGNVVLFYVRQGHLYIYIYIYIYFKAFSGSSFAVATGVRTASVIVSLMLGNVKLYT
jgi:hypothetical protein